MSKAHKIELTLTRLESDHISALIIDNIAAGWRLGRKDHWDKRNKSILEKLKVAESREIHEQSMNTVRAEECEPHRHASLDEAFGCEECQAWLRRKQALTQKDRA